MKENVVWLFRVISDNLGDDLIACIIKKYIKNHIPYCDIREISVKQKVTTEIINQINNSKAVILGGSGLFVNYSKLASGFYWNCPPGFFERIKVPIFVIGVGINDNLQLSHYGELRNETKQNIKRLFDKSELIWVRDSNTKKQLESLSSKIEWAPCSAFAGFKVFGQYSEIGFSEIPIISIAVGQHGDYVKSIWEKVIKYFSKLVIDLLEQTNVLICQVKHRNIDQSAYREILNNLSKNLHSRFLFIAPHNIKEQVCKYSNSIATISLYLHPSIISYGAGVPVHMLGYDIKCQAFYDDIVAGDKYSSYQSLEDRKLDIDEIINKIKAVIDSDSTKVKWEIRENRIVSHLNKIDQLFKQIGQKLL